MEKVMKSDEEWRSELAPDQFHVLREKGTEPPFSGRYVDEKADGTYKCAACGLELFDAGTKYDSGSGWPSFTDPKNTENVSLVTDMSHGMVRTEVRCARCDATSATCSPTAPARPASATA
jgi:peptide-methionine (R)-S-oxide reductase